MPRLYLTRSDVASSPQGLALAPYLKLLGTDTINSLIARASQLCDDYCQKRLIAPSLPTTISGVLPIAVGSTVIPLTSVTQIDNLAEQAAVIGTGSSQETILINPGGVNVTSWLDPIPGTITLASPTTIPHNPGDSVSFVYKEVNEMGSSSSDDPYTEAIETQAAQLAFAHMPHMHGNVARTILLNHYPIQSVILVEHAYSFTNQYNPLDMTAYILDPTIGKVRFNVGTILITQGMVRTTYTGGYANPSDAIKSAALSYFMWLMEGVQNPFKARQHTRGKQSYNFGSQPDHPLVQEAQSMLSRYKRRV